MSPWADAVVVPINHRWIPAEIGAAIRDCGANVLIVDADGGEVPRGTVGEIVVRGDHAMPGYWQRPDDTAVALRDGWTHTGDAGYMDDRGYLFIVDRIEDLIISGGENIHSAEVENVLTLHPAVAACAGKVPKRQLRDERGVR